MKTCSKCGGEVSLDASGKSVCIACLWDMAGEDAGELPSAAGMRVEGYEMISELSRGGMGVVYHARQISPPRDVALKMLLPIENRSEEMRERFELEMRTLADLDHPGILPLYQTGEQDGLLYFTMKLASGGSLAARLRRGPPPTPAWSAHLLAAVADAVHYAHQRGVLHRDLKPGNILFNEAGNAYVADFGLAKLLNEKANSATRSGGLMGTPCYMAPEVALNGAKAATIASDVYGLGAILYELLAGRPPFVVEGLAAIMLKIAETEPDAPSTVAAGVPRDLEVVAMTCLAKAPAARYATAAEVAADVRRWIEGVPVLARRPGRVERAWAWCRRRPALAAMAAALGLSLAGSSVWLAVINEKLSKALLAAGEKTRTEAAEARAEGRVEFMIGSFADALENVGRIELLDLAWNDLDASYASDPQAGGNAESRNRQARLLTRWGRALVHVTRSKDAEEKLQRAALLASSNVPELSAEIQCLLAQATADSGNYEKALQTLDALTKSLENTPPKCRLLWQSEAASARATILLHWRGEQLRNDDQIARATRAAAEDAVKGFRQRLQEAPDAPDRILRLCSALRRLGEVVMKSQPNDVIKALPIFQEGADLARALSEKATPPVGRFDRELAQCVGYCGAVLRRIDTTSSEALNLLLEDNSIMKGLAALDRLNWYWRSDLAHSHSALAAYYEKANRPEDEVTQLELYQQISRDLARQVPQVRLVGFDNLNASLRLGERRLAAGRLDEAAALFDAALSQGQDLIGSRSHDAADHQGWVELVEAIASAWSVNEHPERAISLYGRALTFCHGQIEGGTNPSRWRYSAAGVRRRAAEFYFKGGDLDMALELNRQALAERLALLNEGWEPQLVAGTVHNSYLMYGRVLLELGRIGDALGSAEECVEVWREHAEVAGARASWVGALMEAADAAVKAGGSLEETARAASARACAELYGPGRPPVEKPDDKTAFAKLQELAGGPPTPEPR